MWGCDAYCHVPKEQRAALEAKAEPCIYLGHNEVQNAAYVLLLSTRKVIMLARRDVPQRQLHVHEGLAARRRRRARGAGAASEAELTRRGTAGRQIECRLRGGREAAAPSESKEDLEAEVEEWVVESIVAERRRRGPHRVQGALVWLRKRRRHLGASVAAVSDLAGPGRLAGAARACSSGSALRAPRRPRVG